MTRAWRGGAVLVVVLAAGCGGHPSPASAPAPQQAPASGPAPAPAVAATSTVHAAPVVAATPVAAPTPPVSPAQPAYPPQIARLAGFMPLRTIGADTFRARHHTFDGRGTLIGIMDTGVDPGLPAFATTTTGDPKIADVRDFSGEGRLSLSPVAVHDGAAMIGTHLVTGLGRVTRLADPPYYGGVFRELPLGPLPASDVNANGTAQDEFPVILARASDGWFIMTDTDGDGSLDDERPIRDFAVARDTFTYRMIDARGPGPLTIAVNIAPDSTPPVVDFVFDNLGHGTHVAGIAAGHDMFGVTGFDGVAPGAQILALKVANDARGGITVTGAVLRAMNYAADYAARRNLPLVLNLSFGVGNITPGSAALDSLVNEFALKHPDVPFVTPAGNDGPGLSTISFPGSADYATTVCALYPGVFTRLPEPGVRPAPDLLGWWSSRGGAVAKPDLCAAGVAYSSVPRWRIGDEVISGTSMAAPQIAGAMSLLQSAMAQEGRRVRAAELRRALATTAQPLEDASVVDAGRGIANVAAAYRWLEAAHQTGYFQVRAVDSEGRVTSSSAAYRRNGLASSADTIQRFQVASVEGQPAAKIVFSSDAAWLRAPDTLTLQGEPATVTVRYDAAALALPGLHVGTVWARSVTDTLAGPLFALENTVVVAESLSRPWGTHATLPAGRSASYYFAVPARAGALHVGLKVPSPDQRASLYLFNPRGEPASEDGRVDAGRDASPEASLDVRSDDLTPGVWEAVVVSPPSGRVAFDLSAAIAPLSFGAAGPDSGALDLVNNATATVPASVRVRAVGARRVVTVSGKDGAAGTITVTVPAWATRLVVDVDAPASLWSEITDFGVTVFDQAGVQLSQGPLDFSSGRQQLTVPSRLAGQPLSVELMPSFAHLTPPVDWSATVRLTYRGPTDGSALVNRQLDSALVTMAPGGNAALTVAADSTFRAPEGFQPVIEVRAAAPGSVPAVRWLVSGSNR